MASYNELNALIDAYINRNGVQAITGQILNGVLKAMVEQLGRGYTIMGVADLTTDPGSPDAPESWFASTPGTYTNFGGLVVADAEFAIFSYTPQTETWEKTTLTEGIKEIVCATHENGGHIPNVEASYEDGVLTLDFYNLQGLPGENATIDQVTADLVEDGGQPDASVTTYGIGTTRSFAFTFKNLKGDKGETGVTSVVATVDNTTGTPACTVSLVGQQLTLAFSGLKGAQGDTGSSVDYPFTIVNNLTTDDATQALSAAQGVVLDGKVTQLEAKVFGIDETVVSQDYNAKQLSQYVAIPSDYAGENLIIKITTGASSALTYRIFFSNGGVDDRYEDEQGVKNFAYGDDIVVPFPSGYTGLWFYADENQTEYYTYSVSIKHKEGGVVAEIENEIDSAQSTANTALSTANDAQNNILEIRGVHTNIHSQDYSQKQMSQYVAVPSDYIGEDITVKITTNAPSAQTYRIYYSVNGGLDTRYEDTHGVKNFPYGENIVIPFPSGYAGFFFYADENQTDFYTYSISIKYIERGELDGIIELAENALSVANEAKTLSEIKGFEGKTIVCFGDSITEFAGLDGKVYPYYLAQFSGANVINVAFGGSRLRCEAALPTAEEFSAMEDSATKQNHAYHSLSLYGLTKAINENDFSLQDVTVPYLATKGDDNTAILARIKSINWADVDLVTIFLGTNDYSTGGDLGAVGDTAYTNSLGAINASLDNFQAVYPKVTILFFTPIVRWFDEPGTPTISDAHWSDVYIRSGRTITLRGFKDLMVQQVKDNHIPICDLYEDMGWNKRNFMKYLLSDNTNDGTHPYRGAVELARKIYAFIKAELSKLETANS